MFLMLNKIFECLNLLTSCAAVLFGFTAFVFTPLVVCLPILLWVYFVIGTQTTNGQIGGGKQNIQK